MLDARSEGDYAVMESFKQLDEDEADNLYILLRLLGKNYFHNPRPNF